MLVAGRAVQGLGGGGVVVLVYVCVSDLFSIRLVKFTSHSFVASVQVLTTHQTVTDRFISGLLAQSGLLHPR
jgi:MFS family permease